MTISAKIIADSVSPQDIRLTTLQLRYPKFIHGEFMTHRVFSRNASSSRAIPTERMIHDVVHDPATPVFWGKNQSGMQAREELIGPDLDRVKGTWLQARDDAAALARHMQHIGAHKQIVNRLLEPFLHINVVVTATDWANFFALRRHPDAQPEMKALADVIWDAMRVSVPALLESGQWHLPYCPDVHGKRCAPPSDDAIKVSVARCARVSYLTHEGKTPSIEDDIKLYDRLVSSVPLHASPAEHQATPDKDSWIPTPASRSPYQQGPWAYSELHGNLCGWQQFRKMLPGECVSD